MTGDARQLATDMPDKSQAGLAWAPLGVVAILTLGLGLMRPSYPSWMPTAYAAPVWLPILLAATFGALVMVISPRRRTKVVWQEQIVLITGGGSGIGALLATTLASKGATVVVFTKYPPKQESQEESIHTYLCDVSDCKAVEKVAAKVRAEVGDPTMLVNNAGIVKGKLLLDLTEDDVLDTFGSNTLAHFWILKAFLPGLLARGSGHIVTVSSVLGLIGCAQMTDYCASKAALVNLHDCLRAELRSRYDLPRIRTTLVLPAHIATTLFDQIRMPSSWIWRIFAPRLEMRDVVNGIVSALEADESRVVRLPAYTHSARLLGSGPALVPLWLRNLVQYVSGADHSMKGYGPHPDAAERFLAEHAQRAQQSI